MAGGVCVRSSGQRSLFHSERGQSIPRSPPRWTSSGWSSGTSPRGRTGRDNPGWDLATRAANRFLAFAASRRTTNGGCRGKRIAIYIRWKLVRGPRLFSGSVPSTCGPSGGRTGKIRDQAREKSSEHGTREWEQVPLNKRDHDLRRRVRKCRAGGIFRRASAENGGVFSCLHRTLIYVRHRRKVIDPRSNYISNSCSLSGSTSTFCRAACI